MGPGVRPPDLVKRVEPNYPPAAERMRVEGVVELQALVGVDGSVEQIRVLEVSRPGVGFERATEEAVREWQYRPATKNGVKVRMWVTIRVPFTMR
jgi:protein TonB